MDDSLLIETNLARMRRTISELARLDVSDNSSYRAVKVGPSTSGLSSGPSPNAGAPSRRADAFGDAFFCGTVHPKEGNLGAKTRARPLTNRLLFFRKVARVPLTQLGQPLEFARAIAELLRRNTQLVQQGQLEVRQWRVFRIDDVTATL